jgi:putative ABC transport system substrate-binding protein
MKRSAIIVIVLLVFSVLVTPLSTNAHRPGQLPRIGYLGDLPGPHVEALRQELHDLGYLEGQHLVIEYRWAEGQVEQLPTLAAELVQLPVDMLIAQGGQASRAAKQATSTLPKGESPADMPVDQVMRLELVINLKTAQAMGLTLPPSLLFQADEVLK